MSTTHLQRDLLKGWLAACHVACAFDVSSHLRKRIG